MRQGSVNNEINFTLLETSHEPCATTNLASKGSNKKNPSKPSQDFIKRNIEVILYGLWHTS